MADLVLAISKTFAAKDSRPRYAQEHVLGIPLYQVDAFTDRPFAGNPAAVCVLTAEADASWMQAVAEEMNLSETAFICPQPAGWSLRWFTPKVEVALCGHATLAAAHAIWEGRHADPSQPLVFHTKSGPLTAQRRGAEIELDFPLKPAQAADAPAGLAEALGVPLVEVYRNEFDYLVCVADDATVRALQPKMAPLARLPVRGVIVTAASADPAFDFVSRFFAPAAGVAEDPVTGSAHCCLANYWGRRLGKTEMVGWQASARGGQVRVSLRGLRVFLGGSAVTISRGELLT